MTRASPPALMVLIALFACKGAPRKATPADTESVARTCEKHADYDPTKGAEAIAAVDAKIVGTPPDWRAALMNVCYFEKRNYFIAYTTVERRDTRSREKLCEALRASGATGVITPIYVHCSDGKRCTTCRQGSGEHR